MPNKNQFHSKHQDVKPHPATIDKSTKPVEDHDKPKVSSYFPDKKLTHARMKNSK